MHIACSFLALPCVLGGRELGSWILAFVALAHHSHTTLHHFQHIRAFVHFPIPYHITCTLVGHHIRTLVERSLWLGFTLALLCITAGHQGTEFSWDFRELGYFLQRTEYYFVRLGREF